MKDCIGKILTKRFFHNPIFIVGAGRSGTSVILQALNRHPQIFSILGEAPFITSMGGAIHLFEFDKSKDYYLNSIKVSKEYLYNCLRRLSFEVAAGKNYGIKIIIKHARDGDMSLLRTKFWCAKTFPSYNTSKGLKCLYPEAKFIYVIRNGYDVVHSRAKFSGFRENDFGTHCKEWTSSVDKYRYLLNFDSAITVRHEQLIARTEEVFQNIFSFLGIAYDANPVNFINNTIVHPLDKPTRTGINVKKVFSERKPSYEKWSSEQRELFKSICDDTMRELGYAILF